MADTTLTNCQICGIKMDSIYQFDKAVCDECYEDATEDEDLRKQIASL